MTVEEKLNRMSDEIHRLRKVVSGYLEIERKYNLEALPEVAQCLKESLWYVCQYDKVVLKGDGKYEEGSLLDRINKALSKIEVQQ